MSLFICSKCGCVENTNLIHGPNDNRKYINQATEEYPCYGLQEMLGCGEDRTIKMLCSECNTGTWHGEFDKTLADEEEKLYASYSKYGMCTYYDHPDKLFANDPDSYYSLRMRTPEEIENRKKGKAALGTVTTLGSMFGVNLSVLSRLNTSNSKALRADEESAYFQQLAEYKRRLKIAKKEKRVEEISTLKELIVNFKTVCVKG